MLAVNYRGSIGRGSDIPKAIFADWGNKEVAGPAGRGRLRGRSSGVADPDRLGIGGWSYGGILTDYTIAHRHRASRPRSAAPAAPTARDVRHRPVHRAVRERARPAVEEPGRCGCKVSYPFFHADRIKTPTLFMGGEKDFNVPLVGGEQMYQALRSLGVDTQLVIYPGQFHGMTMPSYMRDRMQRYLDWYGKYLQARRALGTLSVPAPPFPPRPAGEGWERATSRRLVDRATFHHEVDLLERADVLERIALDRDDVG